MYKTFERRRPEFPLAWDEIGAEPGPHAEIASAHDAELEPVRFRASLWVEIAADIRRHRAQEKKGTASC
jgi:hypothetical protein